MTNDTTAAPAETWSVLHLFCSLDPLAEASAISDAVESCIDAGNQVVTAALLGHKADFAVMALGPNEHALRLLQTSLVHAGATLTYSFVSRTEISEYAAGMPAAMLEARLHPVLPPADMPAFCFYPMSKRRDGDDNWYRLSYDERKEHMMGHGKIGRTFHGRVVQVISGSTGLDDYEWGVTLFGRTPDDLKDCVYTMRFDEASARYAEFGPFLYGTVAPVKDVLVALGVYQ